LSLPIFALKAIKWRLWLGSLDFYLLLSFLLTRHSERFPFSLYYFEVNNFPPFLCPETCEHGKKFLGNSFPLFLLLLFSFFVRWKKDCFFGYWVRGFYKAGGEVSFFCFLIYLVVIFELLMLTEKKWKKWKKWKKEKKLVSTGGG